MTCYCCHANQNYMSRSEVSVNERAPSPIFYVLRRSSFKVSPMGLKLIIKS